MRFDVCFKELYDATKTKLEVVEDSVEYLKQQLSEAEGHQEMLEILTEKNYKLSETVEEQKIAIQDLEALKELNEELEENHVEAEKELQAEIEILDSTVRSLRQQLDIAEDSNAEYTNTILQFRDLVRSLQNDLVRIQGEAKGSAASAEMLSSQTKEMMNLNVQLQNTVLKSHAKAIDLELRKLDAMQAVEHLECIQPFLPATFFDRDADCIRSVLLFKRLSFKADLLCRFLEETLKSPSLKSKFASSEIQVMVALRQRSHLVQAWSLNASSYIQSASVEEYLSSHRLYREAEGVEKRLDLFIDLLKREEFTDGQYVTEISRFALVPFKSDVYCCHRIILQLEHIVGQFGELSGRNIAYTSVASLLASCEAGTAVIVYWIDNMQALLTNDGLADLSIGPALGDVLSSLKNSFVDPAELSTDLRTMTRYATPSHTLL